MKIFLSSPGDKVTAGVVKISLASPGKLTAGVVKISLASPVGKFGKNFEQARCVQLLAPAP